MLQPMGSQRVGHGLGTEQTASEGTELENREEMWLISPGWELVRPGVKSSQLGSGICTLIHVLFFFVGLCFNFSKDDMGMGSQGHPGVPTLVESHFLSESFMTGHRGQRPRVTLLPPQAHPTPQGRCGSATLVRGVSAVLLQYSRDHP